jgi:hypothetical protein
LGAFATLSLRTTCPCAAVLASGVSAAAGKSPPAARFEARQTRILRPRPTWSVGQVGVRDTPNASCECSALVAIRARRNLFWVRGILL